MTWPNLFRTDNATDTLAQDSLEQTVDEETQEIIQNSIRIFKQQLKEEWKRQRAPQRLKRKLLETRASEATTTARIFLDYGGFKAWFAYFLATGGKTHFKGRHDRSVTIATFQKLSSGDRISTARRVAGIQPHPTVHSAILKISQAFESDGILETPLKSNQEAQLNSSATRSSTDVDIIPSPNETQSGPEEAPGISLHTQPSSQHLVLEKASLQGIADVFDHYMCGAIRKDTVQSGGITYFKAAVTMDFPFDGLVDCLMSLAIHHSKVEYLAMALFKVHVESVGQVRYVILKEGAKLIPNPEMTLKGVLDDAIMRVLGPEVHGAIRASRMRKKELEEGNHMTECVSMIVTSRYDEGAIINLSLGLKGGAQIQNKLYT
ncbi:hypothetical protein I7I51_06155 [Histoplasma capsulatum]|uniref:Uncharacterized protein n=1 Tax=Ajellomyces capsulatus TaxID=5037 RepID=A0A8A1MKX3_AJECA|nr:hypothetical protein I7I51_06155 [Histoplasma capsulatum]